MISGNCCLLMGVISFKIIVDFGREGNMIFGNLKVQSACRWWLRFRNGVKIED